MRIQIKTTNFDLTDAIRANVEERLAGVADRLQRIEERDADEDRGGEDSVLARVEVGRTTNHHNKGDIYKAQVHLEIPGEPNLHAEAVEADLMVALDVVKEQIEREIRRSQEKHRDAIRRGGRKAKEMLMDAPPPDRADEEEE